MRKYAAEAVGTFVLVFCGTSAIVINNTTGGVVTNAGIATTFGLSVLAMIYAVGDVSGAHINPAVTLGFWASRRFPGKNVGGYIAAQMAGALCASAAVKFLFPGSANLGATVPTGAATRSFILEIILTFVLMLVILCVSTGSKEKGTGAGFAVGAVVLMEAMFAGPVSGASMNPARSLAPAIVSGNLLYVWLYACAPVLGALASVPVWSAIRAKDAD